MFRAQAIDPALREQAIEPGALLGQETGVLRVLLRPRDVEHRVRDVDVAAKSDRAFLRDQLRGVAEQVIEKLNLDRLPER